MRSVVLKAALLASAAMCASVARADDAAKPAPEGVHAVVVTKSPVVQLGTGVVWTLPSPTGDEIQYESGLNVDGLEGGDDEIGARWPSTTWILYLH
jgi:hypothetical protein